MRNTFLIIGRGRLAQHFRHYLNLLKLDRPLNQTSDQNKAIDWKTWDRGQPIADLHSQLARLTSGDAVLLMISDSQLQKFVDEHLSALSIRGIRIIHFSGALEIQGALAAHPLMTFGPELYDLETYKRIPFILTGSESLTDLLPGLPNAAFKISAESKAKYHALCVVAGNFITLLTHSAQNEFAQLGLPANIAELLATTSLQNTFKWGKDALTGPLQRKDLATVKANLQALGSSPLQDLYKAFLQKHWPEYLQTQPSPSYPKEMPL